MVNQPKTIVKPSQANKNYVNRLKGRRKLGIVVNTENRKVKKKLNVYEREKEYTGVITD